MLEDNCIKAREFNAFKILSDGLKFIHLFLGALFFLEHWILILLLSFGPSLGDGALHLGIT
jgi:hypothetical protein